MHHSLRPHLYLDTNVILDALLDREEDSSAVLRRIATHAWKCTTSRFAFAEMLDTLQRERQRQVSHPLEFQQLNRIYDNLIARLERSYPFIEFERPYRPEFWDHVEAICGITNLRARDAIHLATAYGGLCDMVVTRDRRFVRIAKKEVPVRFHVLTVLPQKLDEALGDVGFTIDEHGQATRGRVQEEARR